MGYGGSSFKVPQMIQTSHVRFYAFSYHAKESLPWVAIESIMQRIFLGLVLPFF